MKSTEALQENLHILKRDKNVSWEEIGRKSKGGISGKHVGRIANDQNQSPTLDALDAIAEALGVLPTDLITPGAQLKELADGKLQSLISTYLKADDEGKEFIYSVAEREIKK